jgi:hypothetical protein
MYRDSGFSPAEQQDCSESWGYWQNEDQIMQLASGEVSIPEFYIALCAVQKLLQMKAQHHRSIILGISSGMESDVVSA